MTTQTITELIYVDADKIHINTANMSVEAVETKKYIVDNVLNIENLIGTVDL